MSHGAIQNLVATATHLRNLKDQLRIVQQIHATERAFAAILADGSVVTWGSPEDGGDSTTVKDQLRNVWLIHATESAFAAILADGNVVTWGNPEFGGDITTVKDQLRNVQQIHATERAFAAILADESVVTWGHPGYGSQGSAQTFVVPDLMCTASVAFQALSVVRVRAVHQRSEVAL